MAGHWSNIATLTANRHGEPTVLTSLVEQPGRTLRHANDMMFQHCKIVTKTSNWWRCHKNNSLFRSFVLQLGGPALRGTCDYN